LIGPATTPLTRGELSQLALGSGGSGITVALDARSFKATLTGTAAALNAYLASDAVRLMAKAGETPADAQVLVQLADPAGLSVAQRLPIRILPAVQGDFSGSLTVPDLLDLSSLPLGQNGSLLKLPAHWLSGLSGAVAVSVEVLPSEDTDSASENLIDGRVQLVQPVDGVTVVGSASRLMTLQGASAQVRSALADTGIWVRMPLLDDAALKSGSIKFTVTDSAGQLNSQTITSALLFEPAGPLGLQSAPRLTLPASTTVVGHAATPLVLGNDRISYTGSKQLELTFDVAGPLLQTGGTAPMFGGTATRLAQYDPAGTGTANPNALLPFNASNVASGLSASPLTQTYRNLGYTNPPSDNAAPLANPTGNRLVAFVGAVGNTPNRDAYMSFQLTPAENKGMRIDQITLSTTHYSGTTRVGATHAAIATSLDGFQTLRAITLNTTPGTFNETWRFNLGGLVSSDPVEIRIYAWGMTERNWEDLRHYPDFADSGLNVRGAVFDTTEAVLTGTVAEGVTLQQQDGDRTLLLATGSADALDAWIRGGGVAVATQGAATLRMTVREVGGALVSEGFTALQIAQPGPSAAFVQIDGFATGLSAKPGVATPLVLPASVGNSSLGTATEFGARTHQLRVQVSAGSLTASNSTGVTVVNGNETSDLVVSGLPQDLYTWLRTVSATSLRYTSPDSVSTTPRELRLTLTEPQSGASASFVSTISFPTPEPTRDVQDAPRVALPTAIGIGADGALDLGASPIGRPIAGAGELTVTVEIPSSSAGALETTLPVGLTRIASGDAATDARRLVLRGEVAALVRFMGMPGAIRWVAPSGSALPASITVSAQSASVLGSTPVIEAAATAALISRSTDPNSSTPVVATRWPGAAPLLIDGDLTVDEALLDAWRDTNAATMRIAATGTITVKTLTTALTSLQLDAGQDIIIEGDLPDAMALTLRAEGNVVIDARDANRQAVPLSLGAGTLSVIAQGAITGPLGELAQIDVTGDVTLVSEGQGAVRVKNLAAIGGRLVTAGAASGRLDYETAGMLEIGSIDSGTRSALRLVAGTGIAMIDSSGLVRGGDLTLRAGAGIDVSTVLRSVAVEAAGGSVTIAERADAGDVRIAGVLAGSNAVTVKAPGGSIVLDSSLVSTGSVRLEATGSVLGGQLAPTLWPLGSALTAAADQALAAVALVRAEGLTIIAGGDVASRGAAVGRALPPSLAVAASSLDVQAGGDILIDNLSTATLTVDRLQAGSSASPADIVLRSLASAAAADDRAMTLSGPIRAEGAGGSVRIDAAGRQGRVALAAPLSAAGSVEISSRLSIDRVGDTALISASTLSIESALGTTAGVGSRANPLLVDLQGPLSGSLGGSFALRETVGDLALDRLVLRQSDDTLRAEARLETVAGAIVGATPGRGVDLIAPIVSLSTQGGGVGVAAGNGTPGDALRLASTGDRLSEVTLDAQAASGSLLIQAAGLAVAADGVNLAGNGDLLLEASAASGLGLRTAGGVSAAGGTLSLVALAGPIVQAAGAGAILNPGGSIEMTAAQAITLAAGTQVSTATAAGGGAIRIASGQGLNGALQVAEIIAGTGAVALVARGGSIIDADGATEGLSADIVAGSLLLQATEDVGGALGPGGVAAIDVSRATNGLEIEVGRLAVQAGANVRLSETDAVTLGTVSVTVPRAGRSIEPLTASLNGLRSTGSGDLNLTAGSQTTSATIRSETGATIATYGVGAITIAAQGSASRMVLAESVTAGSGRITLQAATTVDKLDSPQLITTGEVLIRAAEGLRIVDTNGNLATSGTVQRGASPGVLRVEGNQTIAAGQTLSLRLSEGTASGYDQLQVTGTLTLASTSILDIQLRQPVIGQETVDTVEVDVVLVPGFTPQLKQTFAVIDAGSIAGRFTESKGLFGFSAGTRMLQVRNDNTGLSLETVQRPLADLIDIRAHTVSDADRLGMFFNSDYFGTERSYAVGMTVTTVDFLTVDGRFELKNADAQLTLSDGTTVQTRRWLIGGSNLQAFAGLNGPYRLDTDHDGDLSDETPNPSAAGFELTGVDLGLSMAFEKLPSDSTASARGWVSATATSRTAEEFGLPLMDAEARRLSVQVNAGTDGRTVVDYKDATLSIPTGATGAGTVPAMAIDFDGGLGTLIRAAADIELQVADFFWVSGSVGFEKSTRDVVLADGTPVRADMLAFGGRDLRAFAGLNGPYWVDSNLDGKIDANDTTNGRAIGLVMEDVDFGVALFTPVAGQTQVADLKWGAATATAGRVEFVGVPDVTIKVSNIGLDINLVVGSAASVDDDTKVIDFASDDGRRAIDVINGPNSTIMIDHDGRLGQYVRATGDVELRVGDFFEVSGSLGFERRAQMVRLADGSEVKTELISVGGTDLSAFVGLGPYRTDLNLDGQIGDDEINPEARGLGVSGVEFGLALFQAESTETAYAGKRWTSLTGSIERVDALVGLPDDIKLDVHSLGIDINLAHGFTAAEADDKVIDFSPRTVDGKEVSGAVEIATGTGKSLQLTLDGQRGELIRAAGGMDIDVAGFFHASGTLAIEKSAPEFKLADGNTVETRMLSIGGTDLNLFVGVNGPYRVDANGDGRVDLDDAANTEAIGLTASGGEFGLVLADDKASSRRWIALEASAAEVALVGVPSVTATARHIDVAINRVQNPLSGTDSGTQVIDFKAKPFEVSTGYRTTRMLDIDGQRGESIRASGEFEVGLGGFVHARGMLGFEKYSTTVKLADGSSVLVDALSFGGDDIDVFAGVDGPYRVDSNADGKVTAADTPNASARGFSLEDGRFALAIMTPRGTAPAGLSGVTWLGLEAGADAIQFVGGPDINLSAKNLSVEANQVFGLPESVDPARRIVDFSASPQQIVVGTDPQSGQSLRYTLDVQGNRGNLLRAVGDVEIRVGDFFYVGGSLGFEKSTRDLVLADGSRISHDVLTVGGTDLQAFAGLNGGPLVDSNQDGKIDSDDTPGADAVGFALSGVEFGLVVGTEREVIRSTLDQKLAWRDLALSNTRQVALATGTQGGTTQLIWVSTDGGITWKASTAPTGLAYESVSISPDGDTIAAVVTNGPVVVSRDGGASWSVSGARADAYTDVAVLANDRVLAVDSAGRRSLDVLTLSGEFAVGNLIILSGLSDQRIVYQVVANDLTADGKGSKVRASSEQALGHIAAKLRAAVNAASGSNAIAAGSGATLTLTARKPVADGGGWYEFSYSALSRAGRLASVSPALGLTSDAVLSVTGSWLPGQTIRISGIASSDIVYKISSGDFWPNSATYGRTGDALVQANIAIKLRDLINGAAGSLAVASTNGNLLKLEARQAASAGGGWKSIGLSLSAGSSGRIQALPGQVSANMQTDAVGLSGNWAVGDKIVIAGATTNPVEYTLVESDFRQGMDEKGAVATPEQVQENLAKRLFTLFDEPRVLAAKIAAKDVEYRIAVLKALKSVNAIPYMTINDDGTYSDSRYGTGAFALSVLTGVSFSADGERLAQASRKVLTDAEIAKF
ncbi:MAG: hypothetical protein RL322_2739, partial [Pseudomonadota bacterium]